MADKKKPEWAPEKSGDEFASHILPASAISVKRKGDVSRKRIILSLEQLNEGIKKGDRSVLAQAITLIESNSSVHITKAQELLKTIIPLSGNSIRIAVTGAPGAGKSTLIETFGNYLCSLGHKVAVLAIDPSSNRSKGSILGDKTLMESLSGQKNAFIRPSPSSGTLGGVAKKTRESILLCEAAGFNVIIIETIGVGQSEITARSMVDFFMLILMPGGGDELQGFKKGSVELADCIVINKADGQTLQLANITKNSYEQAVHYILPATEGWQTNVLTASSFNSTGFDKIWETILKFTKITKESGIFEHRRKEQTIEWLHSMLEDKLKQDFYHHPEIIKNKSHVEEAVLKGELTPTHAVEQLLKLFYKI